MSHVPVETLEEDAADLQFPKGLLHSYKDDMKEDKWSSSIFLPQYLSIHNKLYGFKILFYFFIIRTFASEFMWCLP